MEWVTVQRPGLFGAQRNEITAALDEHYGRDGWRLAWAAGENIVSATGAWAIYEDAYLHFFERQPQLLAELVASASDVYDDAPSNVASGLDYSIQETGATHLQDIAIRRVLVRLGLRLAGTQLVQIRSCGTHALSQVLSPGRVPFHRPDWLLRPELEGFWQPGTIESFYQSNKLLQARARR